MTTARDDIQKHIAALSYDDVSWEAAWSLGETGPDAKSAVPALLQVLK